MEVKNKDLIAEHRLASILEHEKKPTEPVWAEWRKCLDASETELLRRLEHGQGAQPVKFRECARAIAQGYSNNPELIEREESWVYSMFHSYGLIPSAPPAQPQMSAREIIKKLSARCCDNQCANCDMADSEIEAFARSRGEEKNG